MMDRTTGRAMSRAAHIAQSVADILTTPIGSRVLNREYGSLVPDLLDSPGNMVGQVRVIAATADAIARWEPRIEMDSAALALGDGGRATVSIIARDKATQADLTLQVAV